MKTILSKKDISDIKFFVLFSLFSITVASCSNDFLDTQTPSDYVPGDSIVVMSDTESFNY